MHTYISGDVLNHAQTNTKLKENISFNIGKPSFVELCYYIPLDMKSLSEGIDDGNKTFKNLSSIGLPSCYHIRVMPGVILSPGRRSIDSITAVSWYMVWDSWELVLVKRRNDRCQQFHYTPRSTKLKGYTGFILSVCPSVHLWTELCPLCIFNNTHRIYFIFTHLIKWLQKVCCM